MTPICKNCGTSFPPRRRRAAANIYCSRACSNAHVRRRLTHAELLERAADTAIARRDVAFDPGMTAFLVAMIGLCLKHASTTCDCWRAMARQFFETRECRGVGAW